jgi:RNA polymerase sigma-70 factor (ECF subfamily)
VSENKSISSQHALMMPASKTGTRSWLAGIYDQFHQPIYRYIFRQVGDMETSRELTGEVFQRLIKAVQGEPIPEQYIQSWLYRTSHNIVVDHYRRQKHLQHLSIEDMPIESESVTEEDAELQLSIAAVRSALQELTTDQQQVILLKFLEGLSNKEVAEVMDKSIGAVKSLQHRALAILRHRLSDLELEGIK